MTMGRFTMDPDWLPFHPSPSKPKFSLPAGAVDAHCHVFGPGDEFPFAAERKYTPCDAPKDKLWELRDFLGFERNVIADEDLKSLASAGVMGARFNFVKRLVNPRPDEEYEALAERLKPLGWHVVIYFEAADLEERYDFFSSLPVPLVVDHMGRPDVTKSVDGPEFGLFLKFMRENPNVWCKATCPERLSVSGPDDYQDVAPFARRVVEEFPDRVLWGTDWPHPNMKSHMPDDGKLVDFIPKIAPTEELQQKLLVTNPMKLYWPDEVS
jgi:2-pyrone-4,6-dicarboxylate lactonase